MKHFYFLFLFFPCFIFSQIDGSFGVTIGTTNYMMDTNFLSSKSSVGFLVGAVSSIEISEKFVGLVEINFNNHRVKFLGRETPESEPKELNYNLQNIGISAIVDYTLFELKDFKIGANLGPTATFFYGFTNSKIEDNYYLDPLLLETQYLNFDQTNDSISINAFVSLGLSLHYNDFLCNLRYYKGITDPYRKTPVYSPYQELTGKDNYLSLSVSYFFSD